MLAFIRLPVVRSLIVLTLALLVTGCVTAPVNTLAQDARDSLRIESIEVSFAPDAKIAWTDAARAAPEEPAAQLAYLEQRAIGPIKTALDAEILPTFHGTAPARLKVRIRVVHIPAMAAQIIIGSTSYAIRSDMELVDSRTGRTLLSATNFDGFTPGYGGALGIVRAAVSDAPIDRLSKSYAHVLSMWLKTGQKMMTG
jgi:hypothetical protein